MLKKTLAIIVCLTTLLAFGGFIAMPALAVTDTIPGDGSSSTVQATAQSYAPAEDAVIAGFRAQYDGSLGNKIVGRAIWYMLYGFAVYGHTSYATTGYIDCSQYVSRVYKDFGYSITSVSRYYDTVGTPVSGVYSQLQPGSTTRWMLVGTENLKPGDILTWWKEDDVLGHHIGHVGIFVGNINGKPCCIMTVSGRPTCLGIMTSYTYWYGEHFEGARRVLPSTAYTPNSLKTGYAPVIPAVYQMQLTYPVILPKDLPQGF